MPPRCCFPPELGGCGARRAEALHADGTVCARNLPWFSPTAGVEYKRRHKVELGMPFLTQTLGVFPTPSQHPPQENQQANFQHMWEAPLPFRCPFSTCRTSRHLKERSGNAARKQVPLGVARVKRGSAVQPVKLQGWMEHLKYFLTPKKSIRQQFVKFIVVKLCS